jgi:D-alanine-D-alanine ligase-like ATP-grasp enzyme
MASSLAMNKIKAKAVMAAAGIPVTEHLVVNRFDIGREHPMKPPYVLKPINEGSSFGVLIVKEDQEFPPQELNREDWPFPEELMCEKFIRGRELTCAVMDDRASASSTSFPRARLLRLRCKICTRRFKTHSSCENFTDCLPNHRDTSG